MKKMLLAMASGAALLALAGCTSVESTQKFNAMSLAETGEVAKCQTHVEISGCFFLGLPIFVGSAYGDGKFTMFQWTLTTENVMYLLTKETKAKGASRVINVNVMTDSQSLMMPFCSFRTIQASGTGVAAGGARAPRAF